MHWNNATQNVGKLAKIRPVVRNSAMRDGDWLVREVNPARRVLRIEYLPSGHVATLGNDSVHSWDDDPSRPRSGYLRLKRQLIFQGCKIRYEPLPRRYWG